MNALESQRAPTRPTRHRWNILVIVITLLVIFIATLSSHLPHEGNPRSNPIGFHKQAVQEHDWSNGTSKVQPYVFPKLQSRATSLDWSTAVDKGWRLACDMNKPATAIHQSEWVGIIALDKFGWASAKPTTQIQAVFDGLGLNDALRGLQVSTDASKYKDMNIRNNNKVKYEGQEFLPTYAWYHNMFNVEDGVIIARDNYGPAYSASRMDPPVAKEKITILRNWSDLIWLAWQDLSKSSAKNIRHFIRYGVNNDQTIQLVRMARAGKGGDWQSVDDFPPQWPGWQFNIKEDGAKLILQSSNGVGPAHFLIQHKMQLGVRMIHKIHAFDCPNDMDPQLCIYFHAVDGPLDEEEFS